MKNPSVRGKLCAICGRPAESFSHIVHRGLGGDPTNQRTDGFPACGTDHHGDSCHALVGKHHLTVWREDGQLMFRADRHAAEKLCARGFGVRAHHDHQSRWEHADPDTLDCR